MKTPHRQLSGKIAPKVRVLVKRRAAIPHGHPCDVLSHARCLSLQGDLPAKISAATAGKLKTCAVCGGEGHNKATCPTLPANATRAGTGQKRRCTLCGKLGHRRDGCPEAEVHSHDVWVCEDDYWLQSARIMRGCTAVPQRAALQLFPALAPEVGECRMLQDVKLTSGTAAKSRVVR